MNNAQILVIIIGIIYAIGVGYSITVWVKANFITALICWLIFPFVFVINIGNIFYELSHWESKK